MNERKRRLSMLSSMSLHVATLPFVSYAEKDKVFSRQRPGFRQSCFMQVCQFAYKAFPPKQTYVDISVFGWLRKQRSRFAQDQPNGYFQMKELERTAEAIARVNARWRKVSTLSSMCQHVATLLQFFRCAVKNKAFSRQHPCFRRR